MNKIDYEIRDERKRRQSMQQVLVKEEIGLAKRFKISPMLVNEVLSKQFSEFNLCSEPIRVANVNDIEIVEEIDQSNQLSAIEPLSRMFSEWEIESIETDNDSDIDDVNIDRYQRNRQQRKLEQIIIDEIDDESDRVQQSKPRSIVNELIEKRVLPNEYLNGDVTEKFIEIVNETSFKMQSTFCIEARRAQSANHNRRKCSNFF